MLGVDQKVIDQIAGRGNRLSPDAGAVGDEVTLLDERHEAGEGADELFFGYPSWRTLLRLQRAGDLPVPGKGLGLTALRALGRT